VLADSGVVAFSAQILPIVIEHVHHNDVVKFDRVLTNIGSGYRNTTGVFVVPISGLYMFRFYFTQNYVLLLFLILFNTFYIKMYDDVFCSFHYLFIS